VFSTIDSAEAGFVTGALIGLAGGSSVFLFCSFLLESVMVLDKNGKLVYESLKDNYKEISEINKRTGDRMIVVLGATITGFGLIVKLDDRAVVGWAAIFLVISIVAILVCFTTTVMGLFPKKGEQPGSTDVDFLWAEYVAVSEEAALANSMSDLCRVIKQRRSTGIRMNGWFRLTIISAAVALLFVALSEAIVSRG
jgi:hypothetical protein